MSVRKRVIMFTVAAFFVFACVVLPIATWALRLTARLLGWTLRMVFGVLLAPLWIVLFVVGGLAFAMELIVPLALIGLVISAIVPEY